MDDDKKWIGWNKPVTVLSLMAISLLVIGAYLWIVGTGPKPLFDFDDGTTQGWTLNGVFDDLGKKHDNKPIAILTHNEREQYPNQFPCGGIGPSSTCDDLHNKKGSLIAPLDQLGVNLPQLNFPNNSSYWQVELVSPRLSKYFQNKSEIEAYMGDMLGVMPGHVRAALLLNIEIAGTTKEIEPIGGAIDKVISKISWTKLSAKFAIPTGAYTRNIVVRIRGDWKNYKAYDGAIYIDHIAAIK